MVALLYLTTWLSIPETALTFDPERGKSMTEREMFLQTWEREFPTTLKVLKAFPPGKGDFKPHERSLSARQLA